MTPAGLVIHSSVYAPKQTMDRLAAAITRRGITVFARIDHAAGAADAGMQLRATELLIFGQAKSGTPLMQAAPTMGIDLPLKALCWLDEAGAVKVAYNDPLWLANRHRAGTPAVVQAMTEMLAAVTREATTRQSEETA